MQHGNDKDARLQYLSWRIWFLKRRHAEVQAAHKEHAEEESSAQFGDEFSDEEGAEVGARGRGPHARARRTPSTSKNVSPEPVERGAPLPSQTGFKVNDAAPPSPLAQIEVGKRPNVRFDTAFEEFHAGSPPASATPSFASETAVHDRLYIILISLHGLVRGDRMELGRDSDTGGQVKYVVELCKAMALHPAVHRVELLTRQICDPSVDSSYGEPEECLYKGAGDTGGAFIVRLPCGPKQEYVRKELLWPYVREFADRGIAHAQAMLARMADAGRRCELYAVHGHYADAGEVAVLMAGTLDAHMIMTGHSLGRNKLEHLLKGGSMTRREIEESYAIGRRIEAEERALDNALMVFTSTQQEIDEQWGLYDGYSPGLARVLHFRRAYGRHMPLLKVSPPGLDFSNLKVTIPEDPVLKEFEDARAAHVARMEGAQGSGNNAAASPPSSEPSATTPTPPLTPRGPDTLDPKIALIPEGPRIWQDIARFLRNPLKPAILAMSRPDPKKNITTLVKAFGESAVLRELANLVLIMGNRDDVDSMPSGSSKVLVQVLKLIDKYDLHGSVAYPKHHTQADISDIYKFSTSTRGIFTNIALQEPFGLTVIEAAAHGAPTVATANGGPVDIMATLHHGVVVDPTDTEAVTAALLKILTNAQTWDEMSRNGVANIMAYSWPSHVKRYVEAVDAEIRFLRAYRRHDRTMSGLLESRVLGGKAGGASSHDSKPDVSQLNRNFSVPQPTRGLSPRPNAGAPLRRNISGVSADDMALLKELGAAPAAGARQEALGWGRARLVFVTLDAEGLAPAVADAIKAVDQARPEHTGIGVLSMLGFERTREVLEAQDLDLKLIDFMICNAGADAWHRRGDGEWDADEAYQSTIEFEWDRTSLHRVLKKIISQPAHESQKPLPRLKELLYDVVEQPKSGVHPRHVVLELDEETQGILSVGMGPKGRETLGLRRVSIVADRLKRRLRSKGFRASYTLQLVDRAGADPAAALHLTPVRASRAMALRFLARAWGRGMDAIAVVAVVPAVDADAGYAEAPTSDLADLVAGVQRVVVLPQARDAQHSEERGAFAVELKPWTYYGDRVTVQDADFAANLVKKLDEDDGETVVSQEGC